MNNAIVRLPSEKTGMIGIHRFIKRDTLSGQIVSDHTYKNIVVTVAKEMIAARLAGGSDATDITYGAVGTDGTAVAIGDTTLGTELARKVFASISAASVVVVMTTYFGASEANGTLLEFGMFGNGATAAADSGTMFNRALISEVKTTSETLTVESSVTVT